MRGLITISAAALSIGLAMPAVAQVGIDVGVPGASVRIGDPPRYRDYDRRYIEDRTVGYRTYRRDDCRDVTVRRERGDGTVVIKRMRRCD